MVKKISLVAVLTSMAFMQIVNASPGGEQFVTQTVVPPAQPNDTNQLVVNGSNGYWATVTRTIIPTEIVTVTAADNVQYNTSPSIGYSVIPVTMTVTDVNTMYTPMASSIGILPSFVSNNGYTVVPISSSSIVVGNNGYATSPQVQPSVAAGSGYSTNLSNSANPSDSSLSAISSMAPGGATSTSLQGGVVIWDGIFFPVISTPPALPPGDTSDIVPLVPSATVNPTAGTTILGHSIDDNSSSGENSSVVPIAPPNGQQQSSSGVINSSSVQPSISPTIASSILPPAQSVSNSGGYSQQPQVSVLSSSSGMSLSQPTPSVIPYNPSSSSSGNSQVIGGYSTVIYQPPASSIQVVSSIIQTTTPVNNPGGYSTVVYQPPVISSNYYVQPQIISSSYSPAANTIAGMQQTVQ